MGITRVRDLPTVSIVTPYSGQEFRPTGVSCTNPTGTLTAYPSGNWSGNCETYRYTRSMTDEVCPRFHTRMRRGEIICQPMNWTETEIVRQLCYVYYDKRFAKIPGNCGNGTSTYGGGDRHFGTRNPEYFLGSTFLSTPTIDVTSATNACIIEAHAKVGASEADGLVMLAEGRKTIESMKSIVGRFIRCGLKLRRLNLIGAARELSGRKLTDRWMEGRYAMRPLVYDAVNVVKALNAVRNKVSDRRTFRAARTVSDTVTQNGVFTWAGGTYIPPNDGTGGVVFAKKTSSKTATIRSGVLAQIEAVSSAQIWGLDRPFEMMWELIPFSFVADWFFNVGKTIAAWTPKYGFKQLASWVSVETNTYSEIALDYSYKGTWNHSAKLTDEFYVTGGKYSITTKTKSRTINPQLPIVPTFEVRLDAAKLLDLAIMGSRIFK